MGSNGTANNGLSQGINRIMPKKNYARSIDNVLSSHSPKLITEPLNPSGKSKSRRINLFISYHSADSDFVEALVSRLTKKGLRAWIYGEKLSGGKDWIKKIDDAIRKSKVVIVVLSPGANDSEYVLFEWAFAIGSKIPVVPILLHETKIHPRLGVLQYFDFRNIKARSWDELYNCLSKYS
jgi:hypothetical protein